jgi:hypothetical protein
MVYKVSSYLKRQAGAGTSVHGDAKTQASDVGIKGVQRFITRMNL